MIRRLIRKALYIKLKKTLGSAEGAALLSAEYADDYLSGKFSLLTILTAHRHGFSAHDWSMLELTRDDCGDYLSQADYYGMHPLNGKFSVWIDDKLILKYLCAGTPLSEYMPEYYYQICSDGRVLRLMDAPASDRSASAEDVASLLEEKSVLAIKRISGAIGEGFYKGEFRDGMYYLNGSAYGRGEFCRAVAGLSDYIVTEFFKPCSTLAEYAPNTVNCIRYLAGRLNGEFIPVTMFIRIGTKASGFVENYNNGGVLCFLDADGRFTEGNILDTASDKNRIIVNHPDSGIRLEGSIPMWNEILEAVRIFGEWFPQLSFVGFDFVVTDENKVKIMEANSLPAIDAIQFRGSALKGEAGEFFRSRMSGNNR